MRRRRFLQCPRILWVFPFPQSKLMGLVQFQSMTRGKRISYTILKGSVGNIIFRKSDYLHTVCKSYDLVKLQQSNNTQNQMEGISNAVFLLFSTQIKRTPGPPLSPSPLPLPGKCVRGGPGHSLYLNRHIHHGRDVFCPQKLSRHTSIRWLT